jgi:hypothetical protein
MDPRPKYLTLAELARITGLPFEWLKKEADARRLPCLRVGRQRMFDREAALAALADRHKSEVSA